MPRTSEDRKAAEAGFDTSRIPPGQYYTDKWPVLHAGSVPKVDLAAWDFRAFGLVRHPLRLSFDALRELGERETMADIHCVTRWSRLDVPWRGVPVRASSARRAARKRPVRHRPRRAGVHRQPAARGDR